MEDMDTESVEAPKIGIQDLPVEVLCYLTSFLHYKSRRNCRLVCHTLKESVDNVGISIKIDSRQPGSIALCRSVNVTEVQVQNMARRCPLKKNPNLKKWRTVVLSGPIASNWLNTRLQRNCPNLRVLILTGDCLTSQDFHGLLDLPIFEHLTQLRLSSSTPTSHGRAPDHLNGNMLYLLKSIRSRVLRVLELFVPTSMTSFLEVDPHKPSWKYKPLFDFIESHRNSLEELNTTNLGYQLEQERMPRLLWRRFDEEQSVLQIPTKLKQFYWSVPLSYHQSWAGEVVFSSFWNDLLSSQESLERLSLEYAEAWSFPLERILLTNPRTLKVIMLYLRNTPVLDMSLFSNLEVLQKITICGNTYECPVTSVINLNQLPRTRLTSLNLSLVRIEDDFDGIEFMDGFRPETLKLKNLSTSGLLSNRHYLRNFVKLLLRCRSLNVLHLAFKLPHISTRNKSNRSLIWLQEKVGLNLWFCNLAVQETIPINYFCTELNMSDRHVPPDEQKTETEALQAQDRVPYTEECGDYLELIANKGLYVQSGDSQEQPFNLPRNAESYTILRNGKNYPRLFRMLPNSQPYTMRVDDIDRRRITLQFCYEESIFPTVSLTDWENGNFPSS